jgi:hypothetical protein
MLTIYAAIPHVIMEDDTFENYLIPKGTIILPNCWYIVDITSLVQISEVLMAKQGYAEGSSPVPRPICLQS